MWKNVADKRNKYTIFDIFLSTNWVIQFNLDVLLFLLQRDKDTRTLERGAG